MLEVLGSWRPVTAKRMFGGHGIYHAGLMFALIADGQL
ncbi:MAG: TfoX/Sxy family protein, partial [Limnohabitans sp.]